MWKKLLTGRHAYLYVWAVALIAIAAVLLNCEADQLWKVQQKNLFLCTVMFLKEQLVVPGGLLTWVGTWFTQFLYYPWLGVLLLCAWWWLLMALTKRTFRIPDQWAVVMLIPVVLLLLANMTMGYWIYMLKLRGYFFVATIGTTAVVALLWAFRTIAVQTGSTARRLATLCAPLFIAVVCAMGYPVMGIYALAASLLMAVWSWRLMSSRAAAATCSVVAVLSVAAVPLLCYHFVYYETNIANIYWAELPLFYITENHPTYYIPYCLLAVFLAVLAVTYRADRLTAKPMKQLHRLACQAAIVVVLVGSVYIFWMKDENFHHELTMQRCIASNDWAGVLEEAAIQDDEPTRAIVMMRNLALTRIGQQGNAMCLYRNGSKAYAAPFGMRLMLVAGPLVYYQYGMLNYCNRLCVEMGVEFGFRTEDYQLLVNCALLDDDRPLARKYIALLKQTLFYHDWAEQAEALLGHPELIAKDAGREPITHMRHFHNALGGDNGNTERFLMRQLAQSIYNDDPQFQEQTLLATLWTKDIDQFWYHFNDYIRLHPHEPMPRYYQEAAYLYGMIEGRPGMDRMPFDASVKDSFERFMKLAANYDGKDVETCREGLYPLFGDTYYYDYYTMRNLPEY